MSVTMKKLLKISAYLYVALAIICLIGGVFLELMYITGFGAIAIGVYYWLYCFIHKKNRRIATGILFAGILLFSYAWLHMDELDSDTERELSRSHMLCE